MIRRLLIVVLLVLPMTAQPRPRNEAAPTTGEVVIHMIPIAHDFQVRGWRVHYTLLYHYSNPTYHIIEVGWDVKATRRQETVNYFGAIVSGDFLYGTSTGIKRLPLYDANARVVE